MEHIGILQNIYLFKDLGRLELIQINKLVHSRRYSAEDIIIQEGGPADHMYIVKSGSVSVFIEGAEGRKEVLATLNPGDHFGEMALIDNQPRSANVEANEDSEVLYISSAEFAKLLDSDASLKIKIYEAFLKTLCSRLRATNDAAVIYRIQADLQLS